MQLQLRSILVNSIVRLAAPVPARVRQVSKSSPADLLDSYPAERRQDDDVISASANKGRRSTERQGLIPGAAASAEAGVERDQEPV